MSMKTRQYQTSLDGIDNLKLATATIESPESKQILVKIKAVSLNYKDAETIEGLFKHHKASVAPANLVPCADSVGEVVALGSGVSRWREGDRVLSTSYPEYLTGQVKPEYLNKGVGSAVNGVLTEYRLFDEGAVVRAPAYLIDVEACNMQSPAPRLGCQDMLLLIVVRALNGSRSLGHPGGAGETILLQGTGGVSIMGLLIGKASGARTIITSSADSKLPRAKALGADETINYTTHPDWDDEVLRLTDGRGVDIIFENGGAQTTQKSFQCVCWGGLINSIGYVSGKVDPFDERTNINVSAIQKNFTLKGLLNGPRDRFEEMLDFCKEHQIPPVVDRVFPFEEAREALRYMWSGSHFGKVVVNICA